ncbi:2-iminoacetate synthase ThiH [Parendozoicomonas haliclonae]|uniref:2-iminoacetate synthase n=1 Tax=Parendozoicomonas haliclonae TaxID=1960125 RepID=A0A1X7AG77_9GAMM|nr:2-iminoacetate synthase ThiH [Parendozoicomonas haliclonae]SMA38105.1 2-iminoacetate synthase [Parendozoicomonas haliclonae]
MSSAQAQHNFSDTLPSLNWDDARMRAHSYTEADVHIALTKARKTPDDFLALISPSAEPFLEQMAAESLRLTRKRFGNTIQLYLPLYLSNKCHNICTYCGFSLENPIRRETLTTEQLDKEIAAIKRMGFEHILLVTGEAPGTVGMKYFREVIPYIKQHFAHVSIEVQPLDEDEYAELISLGLDAVMIYQETYHRSAYGDYHKRGSKSNFVYRLDTPDRLGRAGIRKIGVAALLGLEDWRADSYMTACHLDYLQKTYWKTRYSVSFPRIRPCEGDFQPRSPVSDRQLLQLICAWRLVFPEVELSLSTRESELFRNNVAKLGITSMTAASSTMPGGYAERENHEEKQALEQFSIDDDRSPAAIAEMLKAQGLEPVWRDKELTGR